MFFFLPIGVDVPMARWPWMNWVLIAGTLVAMVACWQGGSLSAFGERCVANGDYAVGHLLHPLCHADLWHLLGNLLFLWIFGNAICAKVGNGWYLLLYFGGACVASVVTSIVDPRAGIGASGAINVVAGAFLVWYALNSVRILYAFGWWGRGWDSGEWDVDAYWFIAVWLAYDLVGAVRGSSRVGHIDHLAGLVTGIVIATTLLKIRLVRMDEHERSIFDLFAGRAEREPPAWRGGRMVKEPPTPRAPRSRPPVDEDPIPLADEPNSPREKR